MSISDFVNDKDEKPFHSTGYAEVSGGGAIGSTNSQSFRERHYIEHNRRHVRRYGDSYIATGLHAREELNRINSIRQRTDETKKSPGHSGRGQIVSPPRGHGFSEPPPRYNPYA